MNTALENVTPENLAPAEPAPAPPTPFAYRGNGKVGGGGSDGFDLAPSAQLDYHRVQKNKAPMKSHSSRRAFLKKSVAVGVSAPLVMSLEEYALMAEETGRPVAPAKAPGPRANMPMGKIGNVQISRLICGGNLISGYAHSRDLIYVSPLLKQYFTEEKILETWALSEQHGVNTMVINPSDERAAALYRKYRERGGRIQYLAQIVPSKDDLVTPVRVAKETGAVGALLQGNSGDSWIRDGDVKLVGEFLKIIRDHGLIAGVAGHALKTMKAVEEAGYAPDFYMKTFHDTTYWSARRPDQTKEVIDNRADNYWCMDTRETAAWMSEVRRPWIAYKVLAAGAYHPRAGFRFAFDNGADFVLVGMFDFQIAEDAAITAEIVQGCRNREREWFA